MVKVEQSLYEIMKQGQTNYSELDKTKGSWQDKNLEYGALQNE
jgi:hypothetical protein